MDKKHQQLGINPSTANGRLVKDLLFSFVKDRPCYRCGQPLTRESFSIEHKTPWLDSEDPLGLFFDLDNIDFSHHICNIAAARKPSAYPSKDAKQKAFNQKQKESWQLLGKEEQQKRRREKYLKYGV